MGQPVYSGPGRRLGRGSGNAGKPGKRLRLEDLQSQFGVGLKEAASRLGICATTLKRACRHVRPLVRAALYIGVHLPCSAGCSQQICIMDWLGCESSLLTQPPDSQAETLMRILINSSTVFVTMKVDHLQTELHS